MNFNLSRTNVLIKSAKIRLLSLLLFAVLMGIILLYPTKYFAGIDDFNGLDVFVYPFFFMIIYGLWIGTCALLAIGSRTRGGLMSIVISITQALLLYKISPLGYDHNYTITFALSSYLGITHFISTSVTTYLVYPGLMIITDSLQMTTSLSYQALSPVLMSAFYILTGIAIYGLTNYLTKDSMIAVLAVPFFFTMSFGGTYYLLFPATLGLGFLALSLYLIANASKYRKLSIILILLVTSMIVTHFYDPVLLMLVFFFIQILNKLFAFSWRPFRILVYAVVADLGWHIYVAVGYTTSIIDLVKSSLSGSFSYATTVINANTIGIPPWVNAIRYFDLFLTSIFGFFLSLMILIKYRKYDVIMRQYSIVVIATIIFGSIAAFASLAQGGFDYAIALELAPLPSIPVVLAFFGRRSNTKIMIVFLVIFLSAPSLLVFPYHSISSATVYPIETTAGSYYSRYTPNSVASVLTDGRMSGLIGIQDPFVELSYYSYPITYLQYDSSSYNIVDLSFTNYQTHLYGYPINISQIYDHDITFSEGTVFIIPPSN